MEKILGLKAQTGNHSSGHSALPARDSFQAGSEADLVSSGDHHGLRRLQKLHSRPI